MAIKNYRTILFYSILVTIIFLFDRFYRPDAVLYHLPFVKILNEEKIIFGLFNLHARFAHVSIIQYIYFKNVSIVSFQ